MKPKRFPDPFALTTDPRSYVPRVSSERALHEMQDALTGGRTAVLLAGPPGIGKTLMLHVLAERLEESFLPVYVPHGRLGAEDLAAFLLGMLGAPPAADPLAALWGLARSREQHRGEGRVRPLIALVDDVGGEGIEAVEWLAADGPALRLVAVPASDEDAGLLRRKLADRATLVSLREPLSGAESSALVRRRLVHAGLPGSVIGRYDEAAIQELHAAAEGNPMALHALADEWLRRRARPARPKPREAAPEPARPRLGPREIARATHPPRPAASVTPRAVPEPPPVAPPQEVPARPSVAPPQEVPARPSVVTPLSDRPAPDRHTPPPPLRVLPTASVEGPQPPRLVAEPSAEPPPKHRIEAPARPPATATLKAPATPAPPASRSPVDREPLAGRSPVDREPLAGRSPVDREPLAGRSPIASKPPGGSGALATREPAQPAAPATPGPTQPLTPANSGPTQPLTPATPGPPRVAAPARRRPFEPKIRLRPRGGARAARQPVAAFAAGLAAVVALALWLLVGGSPELPTAAGSIDVAAAPPLAAVRRPSAAAPRASAPAAPVLAPAAPSFAAPEPAPAALSFAAPEPEPAAPSFAAPEPAPAAPSFAAPEPAPAAPSVAAPELPSSAAALLPGAASPLPKTDGVAAARDATPAEREPAATPKPIAPALAPVRPAPPSEVASRSASPATSTASATRGAPVPPSVRKPEATLPTTGGPEAGGRAQATPGSPLDAGAPRTAAAQRVALGPAASAREAVPGSEVPAPAPADELVSVLPEPAAEVVPVPPALIRVHINATPWAEIELDGEPIGLTPLGNVEMTAGEHGFRAIFGDGSVIDRTLEIGSDARRVTFDRAEAAAAGDAGDE